MSNSLSAKIAFASAMAFAGVAHAEVLTFDNTAGTALPGASSSFPSLYTYFDHASVYQNYAFSTPDAHWYAGYWNTVLFCGGVKENCAYNGTDHLIATPALSVKRADGASFALNGFDLDNTRDTSVAEAAASFTVTGFKTDGTSISTIVTLDDLPNSVTYGTAAAFNHFDLVGFTDLSSFEINRITPNDWGYLTLDNLNVTAVTAVPEPSSWVMMGLGLLGLGAQVKRRKG
jgi:hypothetical protein